MYNYVRTKLCLVLDLPFIYCVKAIHSQIRNTNIVEAIRLSSICCNFIFMFRISSLLELLANKQMKKKKDGCLLAQGGTSRYRGFMNPHVLTQG